MFKFFPWYFNLNKIRCRIRENFHVHIFSCHFIISSINIHIPNAVKHTTAVRCSNNHIITFAQTEHIYTHIAHAFIGRKPVRIIGVHHFGCPNACFGG